MGERVFSVDNPPSYLVEEYSLEWGIESQNSFVSYIPHLSGTGGYVIDAVLAN